MFEFYDISKIERPGAEWQVCKFFKDDFEDFYFFLHKELYVFDRAYLEDTIEGYDLQKCPIKTLVPLQIT